MMKTNATCRNTVPGDIAPVIDNLAQRTHDEIDLFLYALSRSGKIDWLENHISDAIVQNRSTTCLINDNPVGIMTWNPENDWVYTTAIASERFFERDCLRLARRHIADIQERVGCDVASYSRSKHDGTDKWFKLLGFHFSHMSHGAKVFVRPYVQLMRTIIHK